MAVIESFVTLKVDQWSTEMKVLNFFADDIEVVDAEDETSKNVYCEFIIKGEEDMIAKYLKVRNIMLS